MNVIQPDDKYEVAVAYKIILHYDIMTNYVKPTARRLADNNKFNSSCNAVLQRLVSDNVCL